MSVSYNEKLLLNQALQGGYPISRVRRNRRMLSLCAKFAFVGAVALVFTGIAIAAPVVGTGTWTDNPAGGATDAIATSASDDLIQLAGCEGNCGKGLGPGGLGPPGNTGPGNQGNAMTAGNAGGFGGFPPPGPPGGLPPGPPGGIPPGPPGPPGGGGGGEPPPGNGGGPFADLSDGVSTDDPWLLVKGKPGADGDGTSGQGPLGLGAMMCSVGGLSVAADGSVIFAQFFAAQTEPEIDRKGCEEVVKYPDTEDMAGK